MLPLHFEPLLKRIRWGGTRLGTWLGKPIGEATDAAESWEVVDHGSDQSVVRSEEFRGAKLRDLVSEMPRDLFGAAVRSQFPLLIKFLDATDRLSLQVHPNDRQARRYLPDENGKTEAWVILDAEPGSRLWLGLQDGVGRDDLARALDNGSLDDVVHTVEPRAGDCYFVPAGTVHAIGEGILLAEVQQSSDMTFRLHDWGRVGADGKPRPIHVAESLDCTDFQRGPVDAVSPTVQQTGDHAVEQLVDSPWFGIVRHTAQIPATVEPCDKFRILMLLDGEFEYACGDRVQAVTRGETILIPASSPKLTITPQSKTVWLEVTGPKE